MGVPRKIDFRPLAVIGTTLLFMALACNGDDKKKDDTPNPDDSSQKGEEVVQAHCKEEDDLLPYEYPFNFNLDQLTEERKALAEKLNRSEPVSFNEITRLFIASSVEAFKASPEGQTLQVDPAAFWKEFLALEPKIQEKNDLHKIKKEAEAAVGGIRFYNKAFHTVPHVVKFQKLQCSSGTDFQQSMLRNHLCGKGFRERHVVVIYTRGHILYGYMTQDNAAGWVLTGIETTAGGRAEVRFGPVKNLHKIGKGAFRIVDAELWMIFALLGKGLIKPVIPFLKATDEMYDGEIPLDELERNIATHYPPATGELNDGEPRTFGFGSVEVPEGDLLRTEQDTIDPRSYDGDGGVYPTSKKLVTDPSTLMPEKPPSKEAIEVTREPFPVAVEDPGIAFGKALEACQSRDDIKAWLDKYHLCEDVVIVLDPSQTETKVDVIPWVTKRLDVNRHESIRKVLEVLINTEEKCWKGSGDVKKAEVTSKDPFVGPPGTITIACDPPPKK